MHLFFVVLSSKCTIICPVMNEGSETLMVLQKERQVQIYMKLNISQRQYLLRLMIKHQQQNAPIYKKIQNYIFKFSDLLGQGNFSKVYKARNEVTNEIVAIKIVELQSLKSKKLEELLFSEIDVLKKLNHQNVLKCFEVFTSNRNCYIITELCNQGDLQSRLRKERYFDQFKAEPIIRDIFEGLLYLAEKNVIHRDLKVANVFMHNSQAKIADFGFAKFTKQKFKDINIGSPIYMSPEGFISNIYGPKTDVWALGVLIYELLHGETPFSSCRTEQELKQNLSYPIPKSKIRPQLSHDIKQVILRCMEVDEVKRITIPQLANLSYFKRILKRQSSYPPHLNPGIHGSALDLRMRSPSYSGADSSKHLRSQQPAAKRRISIEKMPSDQYNSPLVIKPNFPPVPSDKQSHGYPQTPLLSKNYTDPQQNLVKERRAMSTEKFNHFQNRGPPKHEIIHHEKTKKIESVMQILSGEISFKECVNILHYGRLIFKFLLTLKVSDYSNDNELFRLSKWLMELLGEINEKLQKKEIIYEGENAGLREQKLKEVRNQYEKKYRAELDSYMRLQNNYGEEGYSLDYIKNYCFNLYQKYDSLISKEQNKPLIMLGHCIILMCEAVKLLKRCYQEKSYRSFLSYKEIQSFLALQKEQIDLNSYLQYRKKMVIF